MFTLVEIIHMICFDFIFVWIHSSIDFILATIVLPITHIRMHHWFSMHCIAIHGNERCYDLFHYVRYLLITVFLFVCLVDFFSFFQLNSIKLNVGLVFWQNALSHCNHFSQCNRFFNNCLLIFTNISTRRSLMWRMVNGIAAKLKVFNR